MLTGSETPSVIAGVSAVPDSCDLKEVWQPKRDPSCAVIRHLEEAKLISSRLQPTCKNLYLQCGWTVRDWDLGARQGAKPLGSVGIPRGSLAMPQYPPKMFV